MLLEHQKSLFDVFGLRRDAGSFSPPSSYFLLEVGIPMKDLRGRELGQVLLQVGP